ncbi:hypothetical protein C8R46DRAFT_1123979 [Mycena filopes]|nr:hypothetical protein C8R46DRAFT_1123979 [Mycena filopes]
MASPDPPLTPTIEELLGPGYFRPAYADFGIPENWYESWDILRTALESLESLGVDPHGAVLALLHVKKVREEISSVDKSSVEDLQHHLCTNYAPSHDERTRIATFCAAGSKRMNEIATRIRLGRQHLMSLDGLYVAQYELIKPYGDLLSPVRTLPPEILQEIFMACLPTKHFAIMHASEAPLLLGRVCSAWRTISLLTPHLWSSVHIVPSAMGHDPEDKWASLTTWLQRSGSCPLRISIAPIHRLSDILAILVPYSRRWVALRIPDFVADDAAALWRLTSDEVPLLEDVDLVQHNWFGEATVSVQFLTVPRNLRSVSLRPQAPLPACPWGQITTLRLHPDADTFIGLDAVVGLLLQCANLQYCQVVIPPLGELPLPPTRTTLPHLKTMTVIAPSATTVMFLDRLVLPGLEELRLDNTFLGLPNTPDMMSSLNELVLRSGCDLRTLFCQLSAADLPRPLVQCLRRLPKLATLELYIEGHTTPPDLMPVFQGLVESPSPQPSAHLCPALRVLKLTRCDNGGAAHAVLAALIQSRCSATSAYPLKFLNLVLKRHWVVETAGVTIEELCWGEGRLNVSISEPYGPLPKRARWEGVPAGDVDADLGAW